LSLSETVPQMCPKLHFFDCPNPDFTRAGRSPITAHFHLAFWLECERSAWSPCKANVFPACHSRRSDCHVTGAERQEQAALSARASVDHGVRVETSPHFSYSMSLPSRRRFATRARGARRGAVVRKPAGAAGKGPIRAPGGTVRGARGRTGYS
jgi:hypothetical protein